MDQQDNSPSPGIAIDAPAPAEKPVEDKQPMGSLAAPPAEAPDLMKNVAAARASGASWDEISGALNEQRQAANAKGISDQEFNEALGIPKPPDGQQYFTFKDIAQHSARAFIDYPEAAWDSLKDDWQRMQAPLNTPIPDSFLGQVKQQFDSTMAAGKVPLDVFNLAVSPLAATYGALVARPLSANETNLQAMVKSKLEDKITDPDELKVWQQAAESDINTALLALGPEGDEAALAARAKTSPVIQSKDTLDAATAVVGDPAKMQSDLATVANNLHDNWVKTGEPPLQAAQRAMNDDVFRDQLTVPAVEKPAMSVLPETKEPVLDPAPVEEGQKINPEFADDKPASPSLVEPPSPELSSSVAGPDAYEPITGVTDLKDLFFDDPVKAGGVAARYIRDNFVPPLASPEAGEAALVMRTAKGEMNRATAITQSALNSTWRKAGSIIGEDADKFIDYMQNRSNGAKIDPALQEAADTLRSLFQDVQEKLSQLPSFAQMEFQKDYFPQNWKADASTQAKWDSMVNREGSSGFTKAKIIPSHMEGRALGFEPRYDHPLEAAMNNLRNAYSVIAHSSALDEMVAKDLAGRFAPEDVPEGWVKLDGGLAADHGHNTGPVYAPPAVARIYNNAISTGFKGVPGEIFKVLNASSNVVRQMKLGLLNAYHGVSTIIASVSRESGLGIGEFATSVTKIKEGDLLAASKNLLGGTARVISAPFAPVKHFMEGMRALKEYKEPGSTDPATQNIVDLLTKANSITEKMPDYMREGAYHDMWDGWKRGDYDNIPEKAVNFLNGLTVKNVALKVPAALAKQVSGAMSTTMKPIFDGLVPRIKTGAAVEAMRQWMEDHPTSTYEEQQKAAAQIGDSMDNLFGEMMRDNLFWNKKVEQAVNLGFLSYGWVMGELRGAISGAKDIATLNNSSNAQNLIGFVTTMSVINSVYQYMHTGVPPQNLTDLETPRTGGLQRAGGQFVPERAVIPGHTSQLLHYFHSPLNEMFGNEANPVFGVIHMVTTGENWAGYDSFNRNAPFGEKAEQFGNALWQELEPLTVENFEHGAKVKSQLGDVERGLGVRQAPQFQANPEGVDKQTQARQARAWGESQKFQDRMNKSYVGSDKP